MTNPVSPREFIASLCAQNGRNDARGARDANNLDTDIRTAFTNALCFLNELLQNAKDHARDNPLVTFSFQDRELIFFHEGKPFNREDVQRICEYKAAHSGEKSADRNQTGYKDIGFKSVFKVASRVDIWSQEWHFHFDENSDKWKAGNYPWPIAPIWTEEDSLSPHAKEIVKVRERTTFIFKIRPEWIKEVIDGLKTWPTHQATTLLFLKKITRVDIHLPPQPLVSISCEVDGIFLKILVNGQLRSRWLYSEKKIAKTDSIRTYLNTLKPNECPARIKNYDEFTLSFAYGYHLEKEEFLAIEKGKLFCTLPISTSNLPFHVDAPFLLNLSRESVLVNLWNIFLIEQIAHEHFKQIKERLGKQQFTALRVLAQAAINGLEDRLRNCFVGTLTNLLENERFIPALKFGHILKIHECVIDEFRFHEMLQSERQSLPAAQSVIHPRIDAKGFYERFKNKVKKLSMQEIVHSLSSLRLSLHLSGQLLDFFSRTFSNQARFSLDDLELLKSQSFIWTTQECPAPMEITDDKTKGKTKGFFLHPNVDVSLPLALPFSLIHRKLATEQRLAWLKQRGMTELTAQDIVTFYKNNLWHKTLMNKESNLEIIRLLFHLFCLGKASERMLRSLQGIQLLSNQEKPYDSDLMYLPHTFKPIFNLEHSIPYKNPHDIFVNVLYVSQENSQTDFIEKWKTFFLSLGVREECEFIQKKKITVGALRAIPFAFIEPYLASIFAVPEADRPAKTRSAKDADDIFPFIGFPYIQFIANYVAFRQFFWEELKKKENKILKDYTSTTYHADHAQTKKQPHTYLQYVFQKQALIPNSLGQLKTTGELFAPSISQTIAAFQSPSIASIPVTLSPAMEKFLGFKMILSLNDCWEFLGRLQKEYNHASYRLVMSHLLEHIKKEKPPTKQWKFQACNGEWFSPGQLKLWAVPHSSPPIDSPNWIKPILTDQDMEAFCSIFEIEKYTKYTNPHQGKNCQEFEALRIALEDKLPFIAYRLAHHQNIKDRPKEVIQRLIPRLDQLNIYRTTLNEDDLTSSEGPAVILEEDCLYIEENWQCHIDALAEALGKYLELASDEVKTIKEGLKESRSLRHHDPFKKALTEFRQQQPREAPAEQPKKANEVPHSPPPRKKEEDKTADEGPQEINTPPKSPPQAPWTPQVSPLAPNSSPIQEVSSSPPPSPKRTPKSQSSDDRKGRKPKPRDLGKEFDAHDQGDKKAKGNWAEEHVFDKLTQTKYRKKNGVPEIQETAPGVKTLVFKKRQVEFKWHNDPALKPDDWEEKEGERAWDSGMPFDIEITHKEGEKELKKRWIEVKGTPESYPHLFLSPNEWRHYRKNQNDYRLYAVIKTGTAEAEMKKYKNLSTHLVKGTLKPISDLHLKGAKSSPQIPQKRDKRSQL